MSQSASFILSGPKEDLCIPNGPLGKYLFDCLKKRDAKSVVNVYLEHCKFTAFWVLALSGIKIQLSLRKDMIWDVLVDATTQEVLQCGKLLKDSVGLAIVLNELGLEKGDVITIVSENTINYCAVVLAALYIGVIVNPLNPAYVEEELKHTLLITKPKLILCSELALKNVFKAKEELTWIKTVMLMGTTTKSHYETANNGVQKIEDLLKSTIVDVESFIPDESFDCSQHGAFILLSSGTTGLPKGVLLTHQNFLEPISCVCHPKYVNVTSKDITVLVVPFFHIFGLAIQLVGIANSMKVVVINKFEPDLFLQSIQDYRATKLFLVPPILLFLTQSPLVSNYDLSSITDIIVGGAAIAKELHKKALERFNSATTRQMYGLTELSGGCTMQTVNMKLPGNLGVLLPRIEAKVCDLDSKELLGALATGELCFRGPMVMKEYFGNIKDTQNCIDADNFYHTGDVGFYDQDGYFYIVSRLKELIKYKGFQVPPAELEALILTHSGVKDCAVIGIPDERAGQLPLAYVVRNSGATVTEQEIVDYVAEKISVQKRLYGGVKFLEEIPKNASGKILKCKLVEIFKSS